MRSAQQQQQEMRTLEPVEASLLEALRRVIDADDTAGVAELLRTRALDLGAVPFAEKEVCRVDALGARHRDGNEWHALGGRCSWCLTACQGTEDANLLTCAEYAKVRGATECLSLFETAQAAQRRHHRTTYWE